MHRAGRKLDIVPIELLQGEISMMTHEHDTSDTNLAEVCDIELLRQSIKFNVSMMTIHVPKTLPAITLIA